MDAFYQRLVERAASIDELLSEAFETAPTADPALAARRLDAWRRACAAGDDALFARRLARDGLSVPGVTGRFAAAHRRGSAPTPAWLDDAIWVEAALHSPAGSAEARDASEHDEHYPFEQIFIGLVESAESRLWSGIDERVRNNLSASAQSCLRRALLKQLTDLAAAALYERFAANRNYDRFIAEMKSGGGLRKLFEAKPILLRLIASVTRQWIEAWSEFVRRLAADVAIVRQDLVGSHKPARVVEIRGEIADPHNNGRSVQIVRFEDGARIVYKPKDLRLDVTWSALVDRLNGARPPLELRSVHAIARDGYGWTEFIEHTGCVDQEGCRRYFKRAGAWLALFHCFAAADMHQENLIAQGEHPVPIDLEMILQATAEEHKSGDPEGAAHDAAMEILANSVMMVGLLPAYGRSIDDSVFAMGGMASDWTSRIKISWQAINSDDMRPAKEKEIGTSNPNLPHVDGHYAAFAEHIDDFVAGFEDYARFIVGLIRRASPDELLGGFAGLPVRRIVRPTRFYYMLLRRLKNHQEMEDGAIWSAQADFIARLAEWEKDADPIRPLLRAERAALLALNVPHFTSPSSGSEIRDATGLAIPTDALSGLDRARGRLLHFDERDIAWQTQVIRENTRSAMQYAEAIGAGAVPPLAPESSGPLDTGIFIREADRIAAELADLAIRRGSSAAWIGLDWLGDSESFQLACLGPDLYNGASGVALFLAAHAAVTGNRASAGLAHAGVRYLRKRLNGRNAARMARLLGIGAATGLGSVVYALTVMAKCLGDDDLKADALAASELFTDGLIAADRRLDVIGGSAGAILSLLRLYRDTGRTEVLARAIKCGEHLLAQQRHGSPGRRTFVVGQRSGGRGLNGMSHGAAGFAYALASLAAASGRADFEDAAAECLAYENSSYDPERHNWPDLRGGGAPLWLCQWCHGAPGIGLARIAMAKRGAIDAGLLAADVGNAVMAAQRSWPARVDTLCCGTLGNIEFLCEAGDALGRGELRQDAARRLAAILQRAAARGDYRWNTGQGRFNLGLFRGLAGVGYTALRQADTALPNVIIWE